jgi:hypothetical protein
MTTTKSAEQLNLIARDVHALRFKLEDCTARLQDAINAGPDGEHMLPDLRDEHDIIQDKLVDAIAAGRELEMRRLAA